MKKLHIYKLMIVLIGLLAAPLLPAGTLTWDGTQWPRTSLSETFQIDGVTLGMNFGGNVERMLDESPQYLPKDDIADYGWDIQGLWYGVSSLPGGETITLTLSFSRPVTELAFNYYDVDGRSTWEQIAVQGSLAGQTQLPSITAPTAQFIVNAAAGTARSNGTWDGDPGSAENTINFSFGSLAVDTVTIAYTTDRTSTGVLMGNLTYVPEPATLALLGLGGLLLRKRK